MTLRTNRRKTVTKNNEQATNTTVRASINPTHTIMQRKMNAYPPVAAEGGEGSLPEPPKAKKRIRGAAVLQRCWWLVVPIVIAILTGMFLPAQYKPNLVSVYDDIQKNVTECFNLYRVRF